MEKQTSKREFRFETSTAPMSLRIIDESDNTLREYEVSELSADMKDNCTVHGLKQKMTDDTMANKLADGQSRLDACDALWTRLVAGEWEKEREGLVRPPEALIIFVMEAKGIKREVAVASLRQAGKEKWEAIAKNHAKAIEAIKERLAKAKKEAEGVDLSTL